MHRPSPFIRRGMNTRPCKHIPLRVKRDISSMYCDGYNNDTASGKSTPISEVSHSTFLMSRYATFLDSTPCFTSPRQLPHFEKWHRRKRGKRKPVCHAFVRSYRSKERGKSKGMYVQEKKRRSRLCTRLCNLFKHEHRFRHHNIRMILATNSVGRPHVGHSLGLASSEASVARVIRVVHVIVDGINAGNRGTTVLGRL